MGSGASYDIFISYARADNVPDATGLGWVSALKAAIEEDWRRYEGRQFRVFMDTAEIHGMQDWRARILGALRTSKVLLVCLSPKYFGSEPCHWEWQEYTQRRARLMATAGADDDDDGTVASVFFVGLADDGGGDEIRRWREQATRGHGIDLQPWFPDGAATLSRAEVRQRIEELGTDIWKRLERASRLESSLGNLLRFNPYFVGRIDELDRLNHAVLAPGSIGMVTAVHGLGGLGKTELVVQYAHAYRDRFAAGVWQLRAEGHQEILPLIGTLADDPLFGFSASQAAQGDPRQRGREVLAELLRRGAAAEAKTLLILDNVSDPDLLAEPQVAQLPTSPDLVMIASTRLGESDFPSSRGTLGFLELGELSNDAALTLIRDHQPPRADSVPGFDSDAEEQAAQGIVRALGGYTMAVEQSAIYLGRRPEVTPTDFLRVLETRGLNASDTLVSLDRGVGPSMRHSGKTLEAVLETTLGDLDEVSGTVLRLASLLPPDSVPWPWLQALIANQLEVAQDDPFTTPVSRWDSVRRTLASRRLLTATAHPDVARIHRLVGAHLASSARPRDHDSIEQLLVRRAEAINSGGDSPPWEFAALLDALIPRLEGNAELASSLNLDSDVSNFCDRISQYVGDDRPRLFAQLVLAAVKTTAAARPGNFDAQREVSVSLNNVARMLEGTDPGAALDLYQQSLTTVRDVAAARPGNLDAQREVSISLGNVARMLEGTDPGAALDLYQQSLTTARDLAAARPGSLDAQREVSISLDNVARMLEGTDPGAALDLYQQSLTTARDLAAARPGDLDAQREVSISLNNVARMLEGTDPGAALDLYQQSLTTVRDLAAARPGNLDAQREVSISLGNVARMLQGTDPGAALDLYQQSLTTVRDVAAARPGDLDAQREVSISLNNVARMLQGTDPGAALDLYQQSLTTVRDVAAARPGNLDAQREVSISLSSVARMLEGTDPGAALDLYQQSLTTVRDLAAARPGNLDAQREVSISLSSVARMLEGTDPGAALDLYQQSLTIKRDVAAARPGNLNAQRELSISLINVATLSERLGQEDRARECWQLARDVMTGLFSVGGLGDQLEPLYEVVCQRARR